MRSSRAMERRSGDVCWAVQPGVEDVARVWMRSGRTARGHQTDGLWVRHLVDGGGNEGEQKDAWWVSG